MESLLLRSLFCGVLVALLVFRRAAGVGALALGLSRLASLLLALGLVFGALLQVSVWLSTGVYFIVDLPCRASA